MDILNLTTQKISRLKVFFYHLVWTARHKGISAAARFLAQRLGFRKAENRDGCSSAESSQTELIASISILDKPPRFTLIVSGGGGPDALETTLDSIQAQLYPPHQIILIAGAEAEHSDWLARLRGRYALQIHNTENPDLLSAVAGDYFCVLFPGDTLTKDALGQAAIAAGTAQDCALIYADEDHCLPGGRHRQPLYKPDWSPDFLLSTDYISRAVIFKKDWAEKAGGIELPCSRISLYDLTLRITEVGPRPVHLPRVLLTRSAEPADKNVGSEMIGVVQAALQRRGVAGGVTSVVDRPGFSIVHIRPPENILTSILIATRDQPELLQKCLESIFRLTRQSRFEVVLVDHESRMAETKAVIAKWRVKEPERFRCFVYVGEFNFSKINNYAASQASGDFLLLLNNDTEVTEPDWLEEMTGYAARPTGGAVGGVLEYPDGRIQHGGILMGVDDLAVHAFKDLPVDASGYMGRLLVPSNFLAVTGACLMVRAEVFKDLGGLSDDYAVAGGDIDFCLRIAKKGMYNILLPHVRLIHHESATRGFEDNYQKFSRLKKELDLLSRRWPEYVSHDPYYHQCLDSKGRFTTQA